MVNSKEKAVLTNRQQLYEMNFNQNKFQLMGSVD